MNNFNKISSLILMILGIYYFFKDDDVYIIALFFSLMSYLEGISNQINEKEE